MGVIHLGFVAFVRSAVASLGEKFCWEVDYNSAMEEFIHFRAVK